MQTASPIERSRASRARGSSRRPGAPHGPTDEVTVEILGLAGPPEARRTPPIANRPLRAHSGRYGRLLFRKSSLDISCRSRLPELKCRRSGQNGTPSCWPTQIPGAERKPGRLPGRRLRSRDGLRTRHEARGATPVRYLPAFRDSPRRRLSVRLRPAFAGGRNFRLAAASVSKSPIAKNPAAHADTAFAAASLGALVGRFEVFQR